MHMVAMDLTKSQEKLFELANNYPSPHNGQPVALTRRSDREFDAYFVRERGLQSTDISFIFSFVSMGVFIEHLRMSAEALGHGFHCSLHLPDVDDLKGSGNIKFATLSFAWGAHKPDPDLAHSLRVRQTSRKKYDGGITDEAADRIVWLAHEQSMKLRKLDNEGARQAIWLNQRAVFDDMFPTATRNELDHWLRYSQAEKQAKRDGLSYDCMELNGSLMHFIVHHHHILRWPGLSAILKQYYLRTMVDSSDVFYMLAPFETGHQAFAVGTVIMQIWMTLAGHGYYLHPFGTIMSNQAAHRDFLRIAGVDDESREDYLVFIFRAGSSAKPVESLRIPVREHLLEASRV